MEITGYDNVIFTDCKKRFVSNNILTWIKTLWPNCLCQFDGQDNHILLPDLPKQLSWFEGYFCKNDTMEVHWEENGYSLMKDGEGPFGILFRERNMLHLKLNGVTEVNDPIVEPNYSANLLLNNSLEMTVITPCDPHKDSFSELVLENCISACNYES
ncbi:hypothetical protein Pla110_06260 [Polystyrenella longa]|uniref:Uncharacterized protein n=1 Tax=Polystyrenella longa TaxID=2528007 RepID=A0A518CI67_9PLAN|nr:hypothetical protein [Polystyrenella longa]QDU78922.1 hypothetical protein Pla110_06260 [Polystyrenella longa]